MERFMGGHILTLLSRVRTTFLKTLYDHRPFSSNILGLGYFRTETVPLIIGTALIHILVRG